MTLRELAEKKTSRPRGSFTIRGGEPLPTRPAPSSFPAVVLPTQADRLLGTENLADVIPMFPPRGPGTEKEWESASLLPAGSLGMILDSTNKTAWLACSRPGMPPLLIHPFPILGQLSQNNPLASSPCETLHGERHNGSNGSECQPDFALSAG